MGDNKKQLKVRGVPFEGLVDGLLRVKPEKGKEARKDVSVREEKPVYSQRKRSKRNPS